MTDILDYSKCPQCGAVLKTDVCYRCGYFDDAVIGKEEPNNVPHKEVKSLFEEYVTQEFDMLKTQPDKKGRRYVNFSLKYVFLIVLSLMFLSTSGALSYYYSFSTKKFIAPTTVIGNQPVIDVDKVVQEIKTPSQTSEEKTFAFDLELKEGNFDKSDLAIFAGPETNLYILLFDFRHFVKNVLDKGTLVDLIKKDFDMSDDDMTTFFASEFAFVFPQNDFDQWGIVMKYRSNESMAFIDQRVETFKKLNADPKSIYKDYFVDAVKVADEKYVLISNSKVYLDQMKEYSEENIPNLSNDAIYKQSILDIPKLGGALIYKKPDTRTWEYVAQFLQNKFKEFVGLDQMIINIKSIGIGVYQKDGSTRIITSKSQ